jgi:hypothetical protein
MKADVMTRQEFENIGLDMKHVIVKEASMKPEAGSDERIDYNVALDFSGVTEYKLREFAAQKLVINFANNNRKNFGSLRDDITNGRNYVYIDCTTIGERGAGTVSMSKAVDNLKTPEQIESAIDQILERAYVVLTREQGMEPELAKRQINEMRERRFTRKPATTPAQVVETDTEDESRPSKKDKKK